MQTTLDKKQVQSQEKRNPAFYLIKVSNNLIQKSEALHSHVVPIQLNVEVIEIWDRGKQDTHLCVRLIIQILTEKKRKL